MKRFNLFLPDELHERLRKEAFNKDTSINQLILSILSAQGVSTGTPPKVVNTQVDEQDDISIEKPMCSMQFCKQRSQGKYRVVTADTEDVKNLCVFHWNKARQELGDSGSISEI